MNAIRWDALMAKRRTYEGKTPYVTIALHIESWQSGGCSPTAQAAPPIQTEPLRRRTLSPAAGWMPHGGRLLMLAAPLSCKSLVKY